MIKFEDVSKSYLGGFQAIQKVSFRVNQGEMVYLRGHSGAGKSSLLKLIAAIERPTLGRIYFNNQNITNISRNDIPYLRRQIGMIFQDYQLINRKTIYENIALPLQIENYNELNISLNRQNYYFDLYYPKIEKSPRLNFESISSI